MLQAKNSLQVPVPNKSPNKSQPWKCMLKNLYKLVNLLEIAFFESQKNDRLLLMSLRMDNLKKDSMKKRLDETENENFELMDMLQLRNEGTSLKSCNSSINLANSSVSTLSLVNLQYKYEELLASHNGLLKVLELRNNDLKKYTEENGALKEKIENLSAELDNFKEIVDIMKRKIREVRRRKKEKIFRLKSERQTLALVHDRLVTLLQMQCLEKNRAIDYQLRHTDLGVNALLLNEIRKNNILTYENFQLQQELEYLRNFLDISKTDSKESLYSDKTQKSNKK